MMEYPIRLGYACINTDLRSADIFTSRTLILQTIKSKGLDYVKSLSLNNVDDLLKILIYNDAHGIKFFRITSCLFPHLGNKLAEFDYDINFAKDKLKNVGNFAKKRGHRLTLHPGQFVQLGSNRNEVVAQSIVDLENHSLILRMMGLKPSDGSVLIIHGGGTYGEKEKTLARWKDNFKKLPLHIREYIALENDEFNYGIMDLLPMCEELDIPFCLDIFHNRVSNDRVPITRTLLSRIFNTWKKRQIIPKLHVSDQEPNLRRGSHSKTLERIPLYLFKLPEMFQTPLDIMLEVKDKEVSVFKIYYKYFNVKMDSSGNITYHLKNRVKEKLNKINK